MKTEKVSMTERRVADLEPPATGRRYVYDAKTAGLAVCLTAAGSKTWYVVRKLDRRKVRVRLGTTAELTVDAARKAAVGIGADIAKGLDPQAAKRAKRQEATLGDLWTHWLEHAKARKQTWKEDERMYNVFLAGWAGRRLSSIRKSDVQALHAKVGHENGRYAANRVLGLLKAMYGRADSIGYRGENPAAGVQRFAEEKRDRFLHGDELPVFLQALQTETTPTIRDFFLLALLTGARRGNVQAMQWRDISFEARLWRIPETKSGKPVVVPLVGPALTILEERRGLVNGSPWVFPSWGKSGHLVEPKRAWQAVCKKAGIEDLRFHDVRRTLGSWMAIGGASLPIVGKMLGHTTAAATMIYARLETGPVRAAAETATTAMLAAGNGSTATNGSTAGDGQAEPKPATT